jgi:cyclopropane-fatty-acyl-phospholipid synthase
MNLVLMRLCRRLFRTGTIHVTDHSGHTHAFGDGSGQPVGLAIHTARAERRIALNPTLAVPEAYMAGEVDFTDGDILGFLRLVYTNLERAGARVNLAARIADAGRYALRRLQQINTASRSRSNVKHHYDLSGELYRLFLDEDMQYSCAYFADPAMTLEQAQLAKRRHIAAKLMLRPDLSVLDIGSGWGGLGLYLARNFDVDVLGVTLSDEQHAVATDRAHREGLDDRVHFEIRDYRRLQERFDRIVSVGMFEHVGLNHYRTYFDQAARLLKPDGVMLLHTIGRSGPPAATAAFIRRYIFPGGYIPALSEMMPAIEKAGLVVTDIEVLRLHYADTLKAWRERFLANRDRAKALYDEKFCRMWEFYLAAAEASFRWQDLVVFQLQITKRNDTLPVTRDYMVEAEQAIALHDGGVASIAPKRTAASRSRRHGA